MVCKWTCIISNYNNKSTLSIHVLLLQELILDNSMTAFEVFLVAHAHFAFSHETHSHVWGGFSESGPFPRPGRIAVSPQPRVSREVKVWPIFDRPFPWLYPETEKTYPFSAVPEILVFSWTLQDDSQIYSHNQRWVSNAEKRVVSS